MKILLVEDNRSSTLVTKARLERLGATVVCADRGNAAIALSRVEAPDLILLDIMLPDIDGLDVARRIRQAEEPGEWTPIIFLTARTSDADLERGIAAGGDDYLRKPVSEPVLAAKIRAMQRIVQMRDSLVEMTRQLDMANQELKRLSASDGLTGLPNRRHFDETLEREWRRAARDRQPLALLMCDVDHFKDYNDSYGHLAGDEALKQVAGAIGRVLDRGADTAARYGGEEFAIILPTTSPQGVLFVAHKILAAIRQLDIEHRGSPFGKVTASIGLAIGMPSDAGAQTLIQAADRALYCAKREGRNRVHQSETVLPEESTAT